MTEKYFCFLIYFYVKTLLHFYFYCLKLCTLFQIYKIVLPNLTLQLKKKQFTSQYLTHFSVLLNLFYCITVFCIVH